MMLINKYHQELAIIAAISLVLVWGIWSPCQSEGEFWRAFWFDKWAVLMALGALAYGAWVGRGVHWSAAPFVVSVLLSAVWVIGYSGNKYANWDITDQLYIKSCAGYTATAFLLLTTLFALTREKHLRVIECMFAWICFASAAYTLFQAPFSIPGQRVAFMGNASMNGCLIAVTLPFLWKNWNWWVCAVPVYAVFLTGASVPVGVLAIVMLTLTSHRIVGIAVAALAFVSGFALQSYDLFSSNGRFLAWKHLWKFFVDENFSRLIGMGTGSGMALFPVAQQKAGVTTSFFWWAHNDFLQVGLEQGLIGLIALLILVVGVIWKVRNDRVMLAVVLGYCGMAMFNYPARMPLTALLGFAIVAMAHRFCTNPIDPRCGMRATGVPTTSIALVTKPLPRSSSLSA